ncbi:MAG: hypothetical protein KAS16_03570 [Thermoplasmata archaeon]|nr:hypothetical protein [Thermoplasmata archaeon]
MKQTWQKGSALLVVCVMMISTMVALISAPLVVGDTEILDNMFEVVYDPDFMLDEGVYYADVAATSLFLLGEGDGVSDDTATANVLRIEIQCLDVDFDGTVGDDVLDVRVNITDFNAGVFDFQDDVTTTNAPHYEGTPTAAPWSPNADGQTMVYTWEFDVLETAELGLTADTVVDCTITYENANTNVFINEVDFSVEIYLSSIFDDPATENVDNLPNMVDATGAGDDARFEAGDNFEAATLNLNNFDTTGVTDMTCTVVAPEPLTFANGIDYCIIPLGIGAGANVDANYRVNVPAGTTPDIYTGSAVITYARADSDLVITESGWDVDFEVDFNFRDTDPLSPNAVDTKISIYQVTTIGCRIVEEIADNGTRIYENAQPVYGMPHIDQSTYTDEIVMVEVTLENNANHPLYNVEFQIDPTTGGGWDYFRNPQFFWAEDGVAYFDDLTLFIDFLDVGDNISFIVSLIVENDIPIGEHRLPISYVGYWFNTGELNEASGFFDTNLGALPANELFAVFSIFVDDQAISCHAVITPADVTAEDKGDIRANTITVAIHNDEGYNFIDVTVRANFNNTPWYNPIINMGDPWVWANDANPSTPEDAWDADDDFDAVFDVDTDPSFIPDRYPFSLEITAVIEETLEQVTVVIDYTRGAVIDFTGYGPQLLITAFTADDIVPGDYFELELTITNLGDDTARDVFVSFEVDDTEIEPWDLESDFKMQFDWTGVFTDMVQYDNFDFPEEMFYTVESLDVDNIREIVEINLYMEGVYSTPGSTIMVIKISDLAPGQNTTVTFDMIADKDMVNGKPYAIPVTIDAIGPDAGMDPTPYDQSIEVMSSLPGETYNPIETDWFDTGVKALSLLLFLVIVIAILLMVFSRFKGDADDYDDDDDEFGFEDDEDDYEPMGMDEEEVPAPPMDAPAPPAAPEELVEP